MGDKKKKRKSEKTKVEEEVEEAVDDAKEDLDVDNEESISTKPIEEDYQAEFKVLGHQDFAEVKKIRVVSSWIKNAHEFPTEIGGDNLGPLAEITPSLPPLLVERIEKELKHWFPVQRAVIPELLRSIVKPPVLRRRDLAISAPTGSGKTLCYVLPILAAIEKPGTFISSLIVVPVQALVKQIISEISRFNGIGATIVGLSGSESYDKERRRLVSSEGEINADIIVATPSRLIEHLLDSSAVLDLSRLRYIIADEADRMLNVRQEWLEIIEGECGGLGAATSLMDFATHRSAPQKILLSATLSRDVEQLEKWNLHRPRLFRASAVTAEQVDTSAECVLPSGISHSIIESQLKYHPLILYNDIIESDSQRVLVFTNHRDSSVRLCKLLSILAGDSFQVEQITADLFGKKRHKVLDRFRKGLTRVLICSDYLSRGVDVEGIDCVVNYDLPQATRLFIHRAGRTARAGTEGRLVSITEKQPKRLYVKLLKKGNLWNKTEEKVINEDDLKESIEMYTKALEKMKIEMNKENEKNGGGMKNNGKMNGNGGNKWNGKGNGKRNNGSSNSFVPNKKKRVN